MSDQNKSEKSCRLFIQIPENFKLFFGAILICLPLGLCFVVLLETRWRIKTKEIFLEKGTHRCQPTNQPSHSKNSLKSISTKFMTRMILHKNQTDFLATRILFNIFYGCLVRLFYMIFFLKNVKL
jgi:hypothetical protein